MNARPEIPLIFIYQTSHGNYLGNKCQLIRRNFFNLSSTDFSKFVWYFVFVWPDTILGRDKVVVILETYFFFLLENIMRFHLPELQGEIEAVKTKEMKNVF